MKGDKPVEPCYESALFTRWQFGAGGFHTGMKAGQPIHLIQAEIGKFAILTTRFPNEEESERRIIGLFQIAEIESLNNLVAAPEGRIRLPLEEAKELYFGHIASNTAKKPVWKTGLFRYLEDDQVHRILADVRETAVMKSHGRRLITLSAITLEAHLLRLHQVACQKKVRIALLRLRKRESTARVEKAKTIGNSRSGFRCILKFSAWSGTSEVTVEYPFISGDSADLVFAHKGRQLHSYRNRNDHSAAWGAPSDKVQSPAVR